MIDKLCQAARLLNALAVKKTRLHEHDYQGIPGRLRRMREEAGLTQRALAERLDKNQNWVHLCEAGQRRVDIGEWIDWCVGCGQDPVEAFADLVRQRQRARGGRRSR